VQSIPLVYSGRLGPVGDIVVVGSLVVAEELAVVAAAILFCAKCRLGEAG